MRLFTLSAILLFTLGGCLFAQEIKDEDIFPNRIQEMDHYPLDGLARHEQGVVVVRAKLDNDGDVIDAQAISGKQSLIRETLENAKKWKFAVNAQKTVILVYDYKIDKGGCYRSLTGQFIFYAPNLVTVRSCEALINTGTSTH